MVGRSVSQSVGRLVGWSVGRWVGQSVGRSAGRWVGGSVGRSVGQSVGRWSVDGQSVDGRSVEGRSVGRKSVGRKSVGRRLTFIPNPAGVDKIPRTTTPTITRLGGKLRLPHVIIDGLLTKAARRLKIYKVAGWVVH